MFELLPVAYVENIFMDRIMKIFRSRFFLAALAIILEFAQLLAVFILLYEFFLPITVLGWNFHIGVLLYLINRDEIPEFKLPWLIILFLLPVIGAFAFMLLSSNETSKKTTQRYERALLADLRKAEHFILMEYFIVQEGQMWDSIHAVLREKAVRGVSVYFMYDDFGCMTTLPEHYYKQLCEEGIHCIPSNKFTPILSHIHNNRDHRKITVIDGTIGYTGGINLADEYINAYEKHGHWKDSAIRLEGEAVRSLMMLFLSMWNTQSEEPMKCTAYLAVEMPQTAGRGVMIPFGDGPAPIYKATIGKNVYLNLIHGAKKYLYITTPYLICDHELFSALRIAARKGVDVRIITPHIPDKKTIFLMTHSNYPVLMQDGVKIYEYTPGFIHAKNFVCDDKFAVCGTINLDYRSLVHHFECGTWMYDADCIGEMKADFLKTISRSQYITPYQARLRGWKRILTELMKVFSPLL